MTQEQISRLSAVRTLDYYRSLGSTKGGTVSIETTAEEEAALLQAHDYGLAALSPESLKLLDQVMSKMKEVIHP